ncbi:hypothetical protein ABZY09_37705 [Streptomyces sp. NPDC002928]|uniref:hypothetical protein n=1 Tax=Streptomyces sp. NPDC002928 TaxID=3154440 RepID=UPI0033BC7075
MAETYASMPRVRASPVSEASAPGPSASYSQVSRVPRRGVEAGEPLGAIAADAPRLAERAFALVESGLSDYARRA